MSTGVRLTMSCHTDPINTLLQLQATHTSESQSQHDPPSDKCMPTLDSACIRANQHDRCPEICRRRQERGGRQHRVKGGILLNNGKFTVQDTQTHGLYGNVQGCERVIQVRIRRIVHNVQNQDRWFQHMTDAARRLFPICCVEIRMMAFTGVESSLKLRQLTIQDQVAEVCSCVILHGLVWIPGLSLCRLFKTS